MSSKLFYSTLRGWGITDLCQSKKEENGTILSLDSIRVGQLCRFLMGLMLSLLVSIPSYGQCTLSCNDQKNISLGTNGYAIIIPELILNGDFSCAAPIEVQVFDENNQEIGDTVTCEHVNQTFQVVVRSTSQDLSCWSTIVVEDKLAPRIFCSDTILDCSASVLPEDLGYPTLIDNCEFVDSSNLRFFDLFRELPCGSTHNGVAVGGRITRSWTALDNHGNVGTCTQNIYLRKADINDVVFPQNRDDVSLPSISCTTNDIADPAKTGEPMINGQPVRNGDACKLFVSFQDQRIEVCEPASYRIIRRWEITDICTKDVNVGIQNLWVVDRDPPTITCPDSFSVVANSNACGATVFLPQAMAADSCSDFTVQPSWEFGTGYGPFTDVPVGVHEITYTAIDKCGNEASCTTKVEVIDNAQPIAICRDELHIALTNDGFADVYASVFDGGSRDNCGVVRWEVTRDSIFGDSVRFTCNDIGSLVAVRLRVFDAAGLSSTCTARIYVNDETRPVITFCPPDLTIDCSENYGDTYITGYARAEDNCGVAEIYYEDDLDIDGCNIGTVYRTWFAVDSSGNFATCQQQIVLQDTTPITVVFPEDFTTNECGADLSPVATGRPIVSGDNCENILISHRDETFLIGDSACLKIIRTWTILDWCAFDPNDTLNGAKIIATQLIKVQDETAPIITGCPSDITVEITDFVCETRVDLPDLIATDCNSNLTVTNTSPYADANGRNASGVYPIGEHRVQFFVSDGCGNVATCEMTITVLDRHAPTPVCRHGLTIPLTENGFVIIPPNVVISGSYDNCSNEEDLIFELSPNYFTCEDVGQQTINLIVTDEYGNSQFCSTDIFIQDNGGYCTGNTPRTAIGGRIFTEDGEGMQEVPVQLSGGLNEMGYTDEEGKYLFEDLDRAATYTIRPMANENFKEGLSTFDLVLIRKHILGIDPLDSPYKILAADVNKSASLSAFDMVLIRQIILGTRTDFPENNAWRYIDASYQFPDPRNPFLEEIPEFRDYKQLLINDLERDFVGIKTGDVNASASARAMAGGRSNEQLKLQVADLTLKPGFEYRIPFKVKDLPSILGYQFTLDFQPNELVFKEIIGGELVSMGTGNFGLNLIEKGKLTTSWEHTDEIQTSEETVLFTLVFEAKAAMNLSEAIKISSNVTAAEAYNQQEEILGISLQFTKENKIPKIQLYQNKPNPFSDQTIISFDLPASTEGTISIYDITGKLLKSYYGKYAQGYNEITVDLSDLNTQTGVLYYHLTTPISKRLSKKMVLIRE